MSIPLGIAVRIGSHRFRHYDTFLLSSSSRSPIEAELPDEFEPSARKASMIYD